jgi:hypothetical protein
VSTITCESRIKGRVDVTDGIDLSAVNPCKTHGVKPRFFEISWGSGKRHQRGATAECESEDCLCFESIIPDVLRKWNRFNPLPEAKAEPDAVDTFCAAVAEMTAA